MSIILAEALKELALQPGESRCVAVDNYEVEIRRPRMVVDDPGPMVDIRLDIPISSNAIIFDVTPGPPQLPSPIEITESDLAPE